MSADDDISDILQDWPYESGVVSARLLTADDGRELLQMRVDMGVLQMEVTGRPDGTTHGGQPTYLDWLRRRDIEEGHDREFSEDECFEIDREFLQFYHRRVCWFALREFGRALRDADHTLALMDFVRNHPGDEEWIESHERYRGFVLFHRTQAAAFSELERAGPEPAIDAIRRGLAQMQAAYEEMGEGAAFEDTDMAAQLVQLREWLRREYRIGQTLHEQLVEAVETEQYERAARLRDQIAQRTRGKL